MMPPEDYLVKKTRPSPLQNKVDPAGNLVAVKTSAATLMGNRGVLHNDRFEIKWPMRKGKLAWIYCKIEHDEGERREVMTPGQYTELFFLDEATALAAGHRPCAVTTCLRQRHEEFKTSWYEANAGHDDGLRKYIAPVDERLSEERVDADGNRPEYYGRICELPSGTFVSIGGRYFLLWRNLALEWSFNGYVSATDLAKDREARVLTPRSVVRCLANGFRPWLHPSASPFLNGP